MGAIAVDYGGEGGAGGVFTEERRFLVIEAMPKAGDVFHATVKGGIIVGELRSSIKIP